jgi:hypothetical protein
MSFVHSTLTCQPKLPPLPLTQLAAAAAATADAAAAAAAAMEISRLEHALERMTDQPLVESKAFCLLSTERAGGGASLGQMVPRQQHLEGH